MKDLLLPIITSMDGQKGKHILIWIEFTVVHVFMDKFSKNPWAMEGTYYERSEVDSNHEFKFWFSNFFSHLFLKL